MKNVLKIENAITLVALVLGTFSYIRYKQYEKEI